MPMETSMNIGIRPVDRPQSTGSTEGVSRRDDGGGSSAAFSPKTNVSIKNAVDDMAGLLSKIASNQTEAVDKMPEDLQKVIQNVLKQAFSLEETMGQGLGSTLESQRFSMDQLSALSRMLSQLGNMAEKGMPIEVSDELRALLTNLKVMVSVESGSSLEPVLLTKAAFELLDNKSFSELPKEVQELLLALQPQGQTMAMNTSGGSSLEFLKQLVQYFMPRPAANGSQAQQAEPPQQAPQQGQSNQPGQQAAGQEAAKGTMAQEMVGQKNVATQSQNAELPGQNLTSQQAGKQLGNNPAASQNQQPQPGQTAQTAQPGQAGQQAQAGQNAGQSQTAPQGQSASQGAPQGQQPTGQPAGQTTGNMAQGQNASGNLTSQAGQNQNPALVNRNAENLPENRMPGQQENPAGAQKPAGNFQQAAMQQAKSQLMSQTMENTPQAMNTMKNLAQLLMKNTELNQRDMLLLQNFVNGRNGTLNEQDAKQLQQLIRLCQQNVPATVQQAAYQQDIPDLPRLWAFMQLCDMTMAKRMTARQLKKAGKDVATFVLSMRNSMEGGNSAVQGQRSLNFMLPMYMGDDSTYPSYIHVYDEKQPDPETGELKKETWLRLCVLTDNIGAVELTCRVYQENQLDMRVFFSHQESADLFRQQAKNLRDSLKDSALALKDFKIGAAGERRFM